jgi:hypothetical protein
VGRRYLEATSPSLKTFMAPVGGGGVMSLKRNVMEENRNRSPIKLRMMITVHFIAAPPGVDAYFHEAQ